MMANNANSKMSSDNRQRFMEANPTNQKLLGRIALCQSKVVVDSKSVRKKRLQPVHVTGVGRPSGLGATAAPAPRKVSAALRERIVGVIV